MVPKLPARRAKSAKPGHAKKRSLGTSEIVGLKIGATGISAAQVVNNGGKEVVRIARAPLPHGVVDGGEVRDPVALGEALAEFFATNSLPRKGVRLGLANSRIGVRVIEIAGIEDERQLENAIGFRAHEMLSVSPDEAVIDYHVLSVDTDEDGTTTRKILLVVAYRESVDRYLAAVDAAKLDLAGIDLEAFALLRAVAEPAEPPAEGEERPSLTVVNIGHERTTLAISDGAVCDFARVLEWGGADIGASIARALKIAPSEGESLKQGLTLERGAEGVQGLPAAKAAEAVEAVRFELQALVRELLSSLRFHQSQPGSLPIGEILVTGGSAAIPGLAAELEAELGIPVRVADPLLRVRLADGVEVPDHPGAFAVALGLGIED
ncbi:MAG TPA: type IV pilus assembly protein PilM [Gaiellaceae bacterium]|nr:type IV pilus assembly protein PilM [Gaiellaceae bacterium]